MTQKKAFLRRILDSMIENRRVAAQRRVNHYLEAIGLIDPHDGK